MKKKILYLFSILMVASFSLQSCSDNDETIMEPEQGMEYGITVNISADEGEKSSLNSTRFIDNTGGFTSEYDADYVYMHSVTDPNKVVKLPIEQLEECEDCDGNGFRYYFCEEEDGGYTIRSADRTSSAKFNKDEEIYFSSEEYEVWEGTSVDASPITGQSVLIRNADKNKEIYRSDGNYTMQDVFNLGLNGRLLMKRKCSAFRVYFLFTDLDAPLVSTPTSEYYYISPEDFETEVGQSPYTFSGKLYIGPYFCDTYNMNTGEVGYKDGHQYGYYATNEQKYIPFRDITYNRQEGEVGQTYNGYGVSTAKADYLVTPYDENSTQDFTFYAFIKNNTENPESDVNSKYITYSWEGVPAFNTTQVIVIMYNVRELAKAFNAANNSSTRSGFWDAPEKLDIQPVKVLYINE